MSLLISAAILVASCLIASWGESCGDSKAELLLPGAALVWAALIIEGLLS